MSRQSAGKWVALTGGDGNDTLDGGDTTANDTLAGGLGDDTYVVRNLGDVVTEAAGQGNDTIVLSSSGMTYTTVANVETLKVDDAASGVTATGLAAGSIMYAGKLGSTLIGLGGKDTFFGGDGDDNLSSKRVFSLSIPKS